MSVKAFIALRYVYRGIRVWPRLAS